MAFHWPLSSFVATALGSESDMRFIYCACCVCYILNDWSPIDQDRAAQFILKSQVGVVSDPSHLCPQQLLSGACLKVVSLWLNARMLHSCIWICCVGSNKASLVSVQYQIFSLVTLN